MESRWCNETMPLPKKLLSGKLQVSPMLHKLCELVPFPPDAPHWPDQDRCWQWMKFISCSASGAITWEEAQQRSALLHLAPFPQDFLMEPLLDFSLCESGGFDAVFDSAERRAWFKETVAVYVVNLDQETGRWKQVSQHLQSLGIEFQRVQGVDLSTEGAYAAAKVDGRIPQGYNYTLASEIAKTPFQGLNGIAGSVGCAAAHLGALRLALARSGQQPLALVLEDDVALAADFASQLWQLLNSEAPCDWQVISLASRCPRGQCATRHLVRVLPDLDEPAERCHYGTSRGVQGLLVKLRSLNDVLPKLEQAVWNETRPHCLDVDVALASISDVISYYAVPSTQAPGFLMSDNGGPSRRQVLNKKELPDPEKALAQKRAYEAALRSGGTGAPPASG